MKKPAFRSSRLVILGNARKRNLRRKKYRPRLQHLDAFQNRGQFSNVFIVKAPACFSLLKNPDETIAFLDKVEAVCKNGLEPTIDLSAIQTLTIDAILFLIAKMDLLMGAGFNKRIYGRSPSNPQLEKIFLESGFYDYVQGHNKKTPQQLDFLCVTSGYKVIPQKAKMVNDFAKEKLGVEFITGLQSKRIYSTIIEGMANTENHAAKQKIGLIRNSAQFKWWIAARFDSVARVVHFAFLDTGMGIPHTLRKSIRENFDELSLRILGLKGKKDCDLIESALKGESRTSTAQYFRGKGLPKMLRCQDEGAVSNLTIISRGGFYDCQNMLAIELQSALKGTLICWDFMIQQVQDGG